MLLFSKHKKDTTVKDTGTTNGAVTLSPVVATDIEQLPHEGEAGGTTEATAKVPSVPSAPSAPPVPSRKTKPLNWMLITAISLLVTPAIVLAGRMMTDSFTREYVLARIDSARHDERGAIAHWSSALQLKNDERALNGRADSYKEIGDVSHEREDLVALGQFPSIKSSYEDCTVYSRLATLEARLGHMQQAADCCIQYANALKGRSAFYQQMGAFELLLLGRSNESQKLLDQPVVKDEGIARLFPFSRFKAGNSDEQIVRALLLREGGDSKKANALIAPLLEDTTYFSVFMDSRLHYSADAVPKTLTALFCLDEKKTEKARTLIDTVEGLEHKTKPDESEPIIDILKAWLLLEEGRLDDCLQVTDARLAKSEFLNKNLTGLNLQAALHLIKWNVYLQKKQLDKAANEQELYRQCHVSGAVFTPLPYRVAP